VNVVLVFINPPPIYASFASIRIWQIEADACCQTNFSKRQKKLVERRLTGAA